jgi:hypothetical protein
MTSRTLTQMFLALTALVVLAMSALAADPGTPIPDASAVSDQKAGSVLIYNLYASSSTNPAAQNTRINITNTDDVNGVFVHLFFVDGSSCSVADSFICLSKSQTTSFLASDIDPDVMGYIVAVAVDSDGLPRQFNKLIGDEYVKLASGHAANLGAEAVAKLTNTNVVSTDGSVAALFFDGAALAGSYNALPRVLAVDSVASAKDGNDTLLVVNRIGGNLSSSAATLGSIFGILYDELESGHSFTFSGGCQLKATLSDAFPRTTPRYTSVVPAGSTGWLKFWSPSDIAILGSVINKNTQASATSFNGGHNLHKLTLSAAANYTIPVFTAMCS